MCSRAKNNQDSKLPDLLNSIEKYTTEQERANIEMHIKFDADDNERPRLDNYRFAIQAHVTPSQLGRCFLQDHYQYLFYRVHKKSKFVV